jgi:APA family basic amino acid/polyamine antiporter
VSAPLSRRLGTLDATAIGVASMLGAGVFSAFAPAARSAGAWLLLGLVIAAVVAFCNATSSAQLAARYPLAGGTYVYGRERLGAWAGFVAGWGFVVGKSASAAAMATTLAAYAAPPSWRVPIAILAVVAVAVVGSLGVTRTATAAKAIAALVLVGLLIALASAWASPEPTTASVPSSAYGVLQSAGILFFAFAGYARIATLGEEVRDPRRTIPRAVLLALAIALVVYAAVGVTLLTALGSAGLAASDAPLADAAARVPWALPVITVTAVLACLGALLSLLTGVSRTALAMARERDLPGPLARVDRGLPLVAEWVVAALVVVLVTTVDLREVIGFSSFGVLVYYGVANAAAFTQRADDRLYPRALQVLGLLGCATLVVTLPVPSVVSGAAVLAVGVVGRTIALRIRSSPR